jgi:PST family polysaccharide transporter
MKYRELASIDIAAGVISTAIAIVVALRGGAFWALVVRPVIVSIVMAVGVWFSCRWVPGPPVFTKGVGEMLKFGLHWIGFTATDFIGSFADRVIIGRVNGAAQLGFYQKACLFYDNSLDLVTTPLHPVAMTGLSKLRNNREELWKSWSKALSTLSFFSMPAFALLAVTSRDLIVLGLGVKWTEASILLSIFALRGIPEVVQRTCGWLHIAAGRADRFMRWGIVANSVQLLALFLGLPFGMKGVAWAFVAATYLLFLPAVAYAGKPLQIGVWKVVSAVGFQTVGALTAVIVGFLLRETVLVQAEIVVRILTLIFVSVTVYAITVLGIFRVRTPLAVGRSILRAYAA